MTKLIPLTQGYSTSVDDVAREMLERFAAKVRRRALEEAAKITQNPVDADAYAGAATLFKLGHKQAREEVRETIRALIEREEGGGE